MMCGNMHRQSLKGGGSRRYPLFGVEMNFIWWYCFIVKNVRLIAAARKLVCCLDDVEVKSVASSNLRRNGSLWNSRLGRFATAIAFFVFSVSKGACVDPSSPSVDKSTNKRLRSVAVAQVCAIVGAPCGNIRDLVADSEEGAEMAKHDSGDEASVAGSSTEVPLELGAHESALAASGVCRGCGYGIWGCLCCQCGFGGIC
jgi:hypothetical protein